jgi:hypothetical protein
LLNWHTATGGVEQPCSERRHNGDHNDDPKQEPGNIGRTKLSNPWHKQIISTKRIPRFDHRMRQREFRSGDPISFFRIYQNGLRLLMGSISNLRFLTLWPRTLKFVSCLPTLRPVWP